MNPSREIQVSVALKDFHNRDEYYVREEFLIPLFRAAGYDAFGIKRIHRGVYLARKYRRAVARREHLFPDFVLSYRHVPLVVVDAKTPRKRIGSPEERTQIQSYCDTLACHAAILSNGLVTKGYIQRGRQLEEVFEITYDEAIELKWDDLLSFLDPNYHLARIMRLKEALRAYFTDDYIERALTMAVLQAQPSAAVEPLLARNRRSLAGHPGDMRGRALMAILAKNQAGHAPDLFFRVFMDSLEDPDPIVRENLFTCLDQRCEQLLANSPLARRALVAFEPVTLLERAVYLRLIKRTGVKITSAKRHNIRKGVGPWYEPYSRLEGYSSLPINLILGRPAMASYAQYHELLTKLPGFFSDLADDPTTHPESFKVARSCLSFSSRADVNLFSEFVRIATARQRSIIQWIMNG
ncbi:MAG: type I restriction enzyme HsdR N-terminal domain-containing protein [Verrucomicrobiales bacterium]|nr:type I restriction enzyme HsdR N-terminal domain-containing protein [Verrucomicrobiales bacterium]